MADTRISDVVVPEIFNPYVQLQSTEKNAFWQAGLVSGDAELAQNLAGGGKDFEAPFYNDLADIESNVGSDDPGVTSTPQKIGADKGKARRHNRNQSWSTMNLTGLLSGDDPADAIAGRVAAYWSRQFQRLLIASMRGVIADNEANDSSDMVHTIANDSASAVTAAELFSATAFLNTLQTLGDQDELVTAIAVHSVIYRRMQVLNLITFIPDASGAVVIPTYLGRRVIVDDQMPAVVGTNRTTYHSYLFGASAWAYEENPPKKPSEIESKPDAGNGQGQEILYSRRQFALHPRGFDFAAGSVAGQSPTNTELQNAANWDRKYERKLIRIACLQTNG